MSGRLPRRAGALALAVALLAWAASPSAADKAAEGGFKKPRAEILATVKTIGVLPLVVHGSVPEAARVKERYEAAVIERLEKAGFTVVAPAAMREVQERLKQTLGGLYDPHTGRPIADKVKAYGEFANNEYLATHKVDATLWIGIVERSARIGGSTAAWDGVRDSADGRSTMAGFFAGMLTGVMQGTAPALSFGVTLRDAHGATLYEQVGGLQLLE